MNYGILEMQILGNSLKQILLAIITVIAITIITKVIKKIILNKAAKIADKTQTKIDDIIIGMVGKVVVPLGFLSGIYLGLQILTIPAIYLALIGQAFYVLILLVIAWIAMSIVDTIIEEWLIPLTEKTSTDIDDQLIPVFSKLAKGLIIVIIGIMILSEFNFDITALVASLGIGGFAFAFAAQETIADMYGGVTILTSRPFKIKDYIEVQGISGTVKEISLRHTRIQRYEGGIVTIPNRTVASSIIKNFSRDKRKKVILKLGLTYETKTKKLKEAEKTIEKILKKKKEIDDDFVIRFDNFGDSALEYTIIYYINDKKNWLRIRSEINSEIKKEFDKKRIDFAYPTQTIHLKK